MSLADSSKQEHTEEFFTRFLLGEELINTQFHLFSARSAPSSRLTKPRVLCANNVLLVKSSKYFLDLLSSDVNPFDGSLSDLTDAYDVPNHIRIDDYGYGSDSDLDEDDEEVTIPIADTKATTVSTSPSQISVTTQPKDDEELSEDGSESVSSDMFAMCPELPALEMDESSGVISMGEAGSVTSGETAAQDSLGNKTLASYTAVGRLRSLGSRHFLVKDTAFQTWFTLLSYLYTDKVNFLPLVSATAEGQPRESSSNYLNKPRCSAKSMYRLACKVGLDHLRDEALAHIRSNLSEHNILKELSCSLLSSHPQLLEMELDVLYTHIASPSVVTGLPALTQRKEGSHGADIIAGIRARFLKERHPLLSTPTPSVESGVYPKRNAPVHDPDRVGRKAAALGRAIGQHTSYWAQYPGHYEHWRFSKGYDQGWEDAYHPSLLHSVANQHIVSEYWKKKRVHDHGVENGVSNNIWEFEHGYVQGIRDAGVDFQAAYY